MLFAVFISGLWPHPNLIRLELLKNVLVKCNKALTIDLLAINCWLNRNYSDNQWIYLWYFLFFSDRETYAHVQAHNLIFYVTFWNRFTSFNAKNTSVLSFYPVLQVLTLLSVWNTLFQLPPIQGSPSVYLVSSDWSTHTCLTQHR